MERNWDIIREIFTKLESMPQEKGSLNMLDFDETQFAEVSYNVQLLVEAGLVEGQIADEFGGGPSEFFLMRLTWEGHDLFDAIRSDTVWVKTKKIFAEKGISMTFDSVKTIGTDVAIKILKSAIGTS